VALAHSATVANSADVNAPQPDNPPAAQPTDPVHVVFENDRLVVVSKPAGEPTQPARRSGGALSDRVSDLLGRKAKVVHRLDAPVSGLVVFGRDDSTTAWLSNCLQERTIRRGYLALVRTDCAPAETTIDESLLKATKKDAKVRGGGLMYVHPTGKSAKTSVLRLAEDRDAGVALVAVRLHTGRTHQARAHLAWGVGAIVGDRRYGDIGSQARVGLHAAMLIVPARGKEPSVMVAQDPPADFWELAEGTELAATDWREQLSGLLAG